MSKKDLFAAFAREDVQRFKNEDECLSAIILDMQTPLSDMLRKKIRGEPTYLKTAEAWLRRIQTAKLSEINEIRNLTFKFEAKDVDNDVRVPSSDPLDTSNTRSTDETLKAHEDYKGLSEATLNEQNMEAEEEIKTWYRSSIHDLEENTLRPEQYRRKRAQLRVEYWAKLDKLRNNSEPTVVNF